MDFPFVVILEFVLYLILVIQVTWMNVFLTVKSLEHRFISHLMRINDHAKHFLTYRKLGEFKRHEWWLSCACAIPHLYQ